MTRLRVVHRTAGLISVVSGITVLVNDLNHAFNARDNAAWIWMASTLVVAFAARRMRRLANRNDTTEETR